MPSQTATEKLTPRLAGIRLHPIKSLDPVEVTQARIGPNGGLELDRVWALYAADGKWINGKRTPTVHFLRAKFRADLSAVTLSVSGDRREIPSATFAFAGDTERAGQWFRAYFEQPVIVRYAREGFPDDDLAPGPTIVSAASLEKICEWFPELTLESARRRFRPLSRSRPPALRAHLTNYRRSGKINSSAKLTASRSHRKKKAA